jgi:hypothetical protein
MLRRAKLRKMAEQPKPWDVLFAEESVTSAGHVISALIGGKGPLFIEQLQALANEVFALPAEERATKFVSLLASFAGIGEVAIRAALREGEDELEVLRYCEQVIRERREDEATRS